jgi:hypothetical protein
VTTFMTVNILPGKNPKKSQHESDYKEVSWQTWGFHLAVSQLMLQVFLFFLVPFVRGYIACSSQRLQPFLLLVMPLVLGPMACYHQRLQAFISSLCLSYWPLWKVRCFNEQNKAILKDRKTKWEVFLNFQRLMLVSVSCTPHLVLIWRPE